MTALLEQGIWQLMSLTECLGAGIALMLTPASPGEALELTRLRPLWRVTRRLWAKGSSRPL